jgi:Na+-driven multidrug efflux pump
VNSTAPQRSSLNAIAGPIVGEFVLGMLVAVAGLYLASHTSDAAAGSFGLTQVVLESLSVLFRVLASGTGVVVGQALGSGRQHEVQRSAFAALGASTWAGLTVAFVLLAGHPVLLHMLNAPTEVLPIAGVYMMCLAPAMVLEAHNLSMAAVLRAHLYARLAKIARCGWRAIQIAQTVHHALGRLGIGRAGR